MLECCAVLCYMLILPAGCGWRVSFATHPLESRALCVELLEDFGGLLKSQRRVSENNNLVLTGGIRGDAHILHRVEAARPVELDFRFVIGIHADDSDFAVLDDTRRHGVDEALAPHLVPLCGAGLVRIVDNEELAEDERLGLDVLLDFGIGCADEHFLSDFVVEQSEPDDVAIIVYGNAGAAAILEDVLLDKLVRVDAAGLEECEDLDGGGFILEIDALDVRVGGGGGGGRGGNRLLWRSRRHLTHERGRLLFFFFVGFGSGVGNKVGGRDDALDSIIVIFTHLEFQTLLFLVGGGSRQLGSSSGHC